MDVLRAAYRERIRPVSFSRRRSVGEVELPVLRTVEERIPLDGAERQCRTARIFAVAHRDGALEQGDFDTVVPTVAVASAALPPWRSAQSALGHTMTSFLSLVLPRPTRQAGP